MIYECDFKFVIEIPVKNFLLLIPRLFRKLMPIDIPKNSFIWL